ncbi:MAG: hypothetical protein JWP91_2498 [Fibrobacteres bacterium]|nr:hypothetical protein [Fibrobacterota bacterium]
MKTIATRIAGIKSILAAILMVGTAGCDRKSEKAAQVPDSGFDSVFCSYYDGRAIQPEDSLHPVFRLIPGNKRTFRFGHLFPHVSEPGAEVYRFQIDSTMNRFAFDTAWFPGIAFEREARHLYPPSPGWHPEARLEGERTSDSTWLIREWISDDYREWRRRESYRKVRRDPGPPAGFQRECVRRDPF